MYKNSTHMINLKHYTIKFKEIEKMLLSLLDSPIIATHHVGSTARMSECSSGVIDIVVLVPNLHAITTLDEKRLNLAGFYRLHHPYQKKCVYCQFDNLRSLNETVRLHILDDNSEKAIRYLYTEKVLKDNSMLDASFNQYKSTLLHLSKKEYEEAKSNWLKTNIAKKDKN